MKRRRITSLPSNGNAIQKLKNQAFFSIAPEWFKASPRNWLSLQSHYTFEKNSPERSSAVCTRTCMYTRFRSSVIFATDAHCKYNSLRSAATKILDLPLQKAALRLYTAQDYKRDGFRILSKSVWSRLEAILFSFFAFPIGSRHWNDRFDWVLCLGSPFELSASLDVSFKLFPFIIKFSSLSAPTKIPYDCFIYCNPLLFLCRLNFGNFGTGIFLLKLNIFLNFSSGLTDAAACSKSSGTLSRYRNFLRAKRWIFALPKIVRFRNKSGLQNMFLFPFDLCQPEFNGDQLSMESDVRESQSSKFSSPSSFFWDFVGLEPSGRSSYRSPPKRESNALARHTTGPSSQSDLRMRINQQKKARNQEVEEEDEWEQNW